MPRSKQQPNAESGASPAGDALKPPAAGKPAKPAATSPPIAAAKFPVRRQADIAIVFGASIDTVKNWAKSGMPGRPGAYDLAEIYQWLHTIGPRKPKPIPRADADDELMVAEGESVGLERYRLAKAALAELELEKQKGSLLSTEKARGMLDRWSQILRRLGETFAKRYGRDCVSALNDALAECERVVEHEFTDADRTADSGQPADHVPAQ